MRTEQNRTENGIIVLLAGSVCLTVGLSLLVIAELSFLRPGFLRLAWFSSPAARWLLFVINTVAVAACWFVACLVWLVIAGCLVGWLFVCWLVWLVYWLVRLSLLGLLAGLVAWLLLVAGYSRSLLSSVSLLLVWLVAGRFSL
jgi:hypothetical protein